MSRHNKVNPAHYTIAGRLTPDDLARERRKQATTSRVACRREDDALGRHGGPEAPPQAAGPPGRRSGQDRQGGQGGPRHPQRRLAGAETVDFLENARPAAERRDAHRRPSRVDRGACPESNPHPSLIAAGTRAC